MNIYTPSAYLQLHNYYFHARGSCTALRLSVSKLALGSRLAYICVCRPLNHTYCLVTFPFLLTVQVYIFVLPDKYECMHKALTSGLCSLL